MLLNIFLVLASVAHLTNGDTPDPECENRPERILCISVPMDKIIAPSNEPWNMTRLWIRRPPDITTISKQFLSQLPKLENLDVQDSQIDTLEPFLFSQTSITLLNIRQSPIRNVPVQLLENSTVTIFFFQEHLNLIVPENKHFLESQTLESLHIDHCNISRIYPETFAALPNLSTLSLMENQLLTIPDSAFSSNPTLSILFLERNNLTTLSLGVFSSSFNGKLSLYPEWNPWECDSRLLPLLTWPKVQVNLEGAQCGNPKGKNWAQAIEYLRGNQAG